MKTLATPPAEPTPIRWTPEEYQHLGTSGVFGNRRVELIEGTIIEMSPVGRRHWITTNLVAEALEKAFGEGFFVSVQNPIYLATSEPEPDVAVLRGSPRDYADSSVPMRPELVVEVADSSLEYDRRQKTSVYARAGIAEYWLVNLGTDAVEVRRHPDTIQGVYQSEQVFQRGDTISILVLSDIAISVDTLLP